MQLIEVFLWKHPLIVVKKWGWHTVYGYISFVELSYHTPLGRITRLRREPSRRRSVREQTNR